MATIQEDIKLLVRSPLGKGVTAAIDEAILRLQVLQAQIVATNASNARAGRSMKAMGQGAVQTARGVRNLNQHMREMGDTVQGAATKVGLWIIATSAVLGTLRALQAGIRVFADVEMETARLVRVGRNLDRGYANTRAGAEALTREVQRLSVELGSAGTEGFEAAVTFSRLGMTVQEAAEATRTALLAQAIAEINAGDAAKYLTSAMLQFKLEARDIPRILDQANTLSNNYRVTTEDLFQAIGRGGVVWSEAKGSLEGFMGTVAAVAQATSQSGTKIGTAFKTIGTRIGHVRHQAAYFGVMGKELVDVHGRIQPIEDILLDVAVAWGRLNDAERAELGQALAGIRQRNVLVSAVRNYWTALGAVVKQLKETGSAEAEFKTVSGTLTTEMGRLKASAERLATVLGEHGVGFAAKAALVSIRGLLELFRLAPILVVPAATALGLFVAAMVNAAGQTALIANTMLVFRAAMSNTLRLLMSWPGQIELAVLTWEKLKAAIIVTGLALRTFATFMLTTPAGLVITGITAVTGAMYLMNRATEKAREAMEKQRTTAETNLNSHRRLADIYHKVAKALEAAKKAGKAGSETQKAIGARFGTTSVERLRTMAREEELLAKQTKTALAGIYEEQRKDYKGQLDAKLGHVREYTAGAQIYAERVRLLEQKGQKSGDLEWGVASTKQIAATRKAAELTLKYADSIATLRKQLSELAGKNADEIEDWAVDMGIGMESAKEHVKEFGKVLQHRVQMEQAFSPTPVARLVAELRVLAASMEEVKAKREALTEGREAGKRVAYGELLRDMQARTVEAKRELELAKRKQGLDKALRAAKQGDRIADARATLRTKNDLEKALALQQEIMRRKRETEDLLAKGTSREDQGVLEARLEEQKLELLKRQTDVVIARLRAEKKITDEIRAQLGQLDTDDLAQFMNLSKRKQPFTMRQFGQMDPKQRGYLFNSFPHLLPPGLPGVVADMAGGVGGGGRGRRGRGVPVDEMRQRPGGGGQVVPLPGMRPRIGGGAGPAGPAAAAPGPAAAPILTRKGKESWRQWLDMSTEESVPIGGGEARMVRRSRQSPIGRLLNQVRTERAKELDLDFRSRTGNADIAAQLQEQSKLVDELELQLKEMVRKHAPRGGAGVLPEDFGVPDAWKGGLNNAGPVLGGEGFGATRDGRPDEMQRGRMSIKKGDPNGVPIGPDGRPMPELRSDAGAVQDYANTTPVLTVNVPGVGAGLADGLSGLADSLRTMFEGLVAEEFAKFNEEVIIDIDSRRTDRAPREVAI